MTIIAFIGSVFSPWYAAARRRGHPDPLDHVSINVALYGGSTARWAMTERGRRALDRTEDQLQIGPSSMAVRNGRIEIGINEWSVPLPRRVRGRVVIDPGVVFHDSHLLDARGLHRWRPIAPFARVAVDFDAPGLGWQGTGYVDSNCGDEPLEQGFRSWTWSRSTQAHGTTIYYDVERRDSSRAAIAVTLGADGSVTAPEQPQFHMLPKPLWRVGRSVRSGAAPRNVRTFEDAPFYTRTALDSVLGGEPAATVCESVDLDRFASRWVQTLLPFRMPRIR